MPSGALADSPNLCSPICQACQSCTSWFANDTFLVSRHGCTGCRIRAPGLLCTTMPSQVSSAAGRFLTCARSARWQDIDQPWCALLTLQRAQEHCSLQRRSALLLTTKGVYHKRATVGQGQAHCGSLCTQTAGACRASLPLSLSLCRVLVESERERDALLCSEDQLAAVLFKANQQFETLNACAQGCSTC